MQAMNHRRQSTAAPSYRKSIPDYAESVLEGSGAFGCRDAGFHATQAASLARVVQLAIFHMQENEEFDSIAMDAIGNVMATIEGHALRAFSVTNEEPLGKIETRMGAGEITQ